MKRISLIVLIIAILFGSVTPVQAINPGVNAKSAVLIDGTTGAVLWSNNARQKLPIASTTKIMTAIIVLERANISGTVKVSKEIEEVGESEIGLKKNDKIKVKKLLEAMMVYSANDAAVALAIYTSGSVNNFVKLMNKKAKEIGATDTNFMDSDGLSSNNHYSTAYDMALIGRYAMQKPLFRKIAAMKNVVINKKRGIVFPTRNKLLFRYPYAIGIKTGYTRPAGSCLVSASSKNNRYLIAVTLGALSSNESFLNAQKLYEFGYKNFKYVNVSKQGQQMDLINVPFTYAKLPLIAKKDVGYFKPPKSKIRTNIILSSQSFFPIKKNSVRGWLVVKNKGEIVYKTELLAGKNFETPSVWRKFSFRVSDWFSTVKSFFDRIAFQ